MSSSDFGEGSAAEPFQGHRRDWGGSPTVLVSAVSNRPKALLALRDIAVQGEGATLGDRNSHFMRFFEMWRGFTSATTWSPTRDVVDNPTTQQGGPGTLITNQRTARWGELADQRYRRLLRYLHHFLLRSDGLYTANGDRTARGYLQLWAFDEMRRLGKIANFLPDLPLADDADDRRAGAPFTFHPTSHLAVLDEAERWRAHEEELHRGLTLIASMRPDPQSGAHRFLEYLHAADTHALAIVAAILRQQAEPTADRFQKVAQILEESVRGFDIRASHGSFWRNKTVGQFIAHHVSEGPVLVPGDPDRSLLVEMIRGDVGAAMPRGRPPIPAERQTYIRTWIADGCLDGNPPGQISVRGEPDPRLP